jgi:hypothetical protein
MAAMTVLARTPATTVATMATGIAAVVRMPRGVIVSRVVSIGNSSRLVTTIDCFMSNSLLFLNCCVVGPQACFSLTLEW